MRGSRELWTCLTEIRESLERTCQVDMSNWSGRKVSRVRARREYRGKVHRIALPAIGCVDDGEGIIRKNEVAGDELGLRFKVMVATTDLAQTEILGVGDGDLGVGD